MRTTTAILAVFSFVLAVYNFWRARQRDKRDVQSGPPFLVKITKPRKVNRDER